MRRRMFAALLCAVLLAKDSAAVVNNSAGGVTVEGGDAAGGGGQTSEAGSGETKVADSVAASSEVEANRREAPIVPHEVYGPPQDDFGAPLDTYGPPPDTYLPAAPSNPGLPVPVYGVPDGPSSNVVYPSPPAGVPPPLPSFGPPKSMYGPPKEFFGPPKDTYGTPIEQYGPPKDVYGPPKISFGSPKPAYGPPPTKYGPPPPASFAKLPKPSIPGSFFKPKPFYGPPPKVQYGPPSKPFFKPKPVYGPPKIQFGGLKPAYGPPPKPVYGSPKPTYGPPPNKYGPPPPAYGSPQLHGPPAAVYGPPDPVPHGPPHPGAPAPPTPPDIKYDGWQPMPGLVSRPPSDTYGLLHGQPHNVADLHFNTDFVPPPAIGKGLSALSLGSSYGSSAGISDSYGAPLNTVTGTGNIISTSGDAHIHNQDQSAISLGLSAAGIGGGHNGQLSVVKSIGYEIFPNGGGHGHGHGHGHSHSSNSLSFGSDVHGAQPATSYPSSGSYPAAHSHKQHGSTAFSSNSFGKGLSFSSSEIGLVPPSGLYGVPPSGQYGTPLLPKAPPKHPVFFREPVPQGLIQSIGSHVAHNDAAGIIEPPGSFSGPQYIPPPVEDLKDKPKIPSNLYSLPTSHSSVQFQSSASGFQQSSFFGGAQSPALTSYNAPVANIDTSYGVPAQNGHIDLTHLGSTSFHSNIPHDCSAHKFQTLPKLSYGVPSANGYTASLSSLTTSIGGIAPSAPTSSYGTPDLQTAFTVSKGSSVNSVQADTQADSHSQSVAEGFAPGSELIKSQSIDFNNIPLQGALGSYTLQIQPADGTAGTGSSSVQVPHDQVLNDGLLQSILAAIEQPQQKNADGHGHIYGQPLLTTGADQAQSVSDRLQLPSEDIAAQFNKQLDDEGQHSVREQVVVIAPHTSGEVAPQTEIKAGDEESPKTQTHAEDDASVQLIDDNEIALYFNDKFEQQKSDKPTKSDASEMVVRAGKSGTYVSFQAPSASYSFGSVQPESSATN